LDEMEDEIGQLGLKPLQALDFFWWEIFGDSLCNFFLRNQWSRLRVHLKLPTQGLLINLARSNSISQNLREMSR